ncbi:glycosyltransferase family 4 protein [Bizionia sp. KMM 8389]
MPKPKLIRITTVPISLEKLLEGQLTFMQDHFDVTAVSAEGERLKAFGEANNVKVFPLEMTRQITPVQDLKALIKLIRFFRKEKPTIVHTHTPKAGIVGMLAAKISGVPLRLHTVAGLPLMEATGKKRTLLNAVEKLTYSCATKVYPNSKGLYDFILKEKFTSPNKLDIIADGSSNGINTQHFNPEHFSVESNKSLRKSLGIKPTDVVFIFVGRLVADKGINELVAAFKSVTDTENNTQAKLVLVGPLETELDPLLPETLHEMDANPNIITVGYQNDVRPFFAISNVLAFPSYREGFPNVVMQAGAMGLPAIVSNINGCNEIITDHKNGIIIPVKDKEAISKAIQQCLENKSQMESLKTQARPMIVNRYEQEKVWSALLEEYNQLIRKLV